MKKRYYIETTYQDYGGETVRTHKEYWTKLGTVLNYGKCLHRGYDYVALVRKQDRCILKMWPKPEVRDTDPAPEEME